MKKISLCVVLLITFANVSYAGIDITSVTVTAKKKECQVHANYSKHYLDLYIAELQKDPPNDKHLKEYERLIRKYQKKLKSCLKWSWLPDISGGVGGTF